MLLLAGFSPTLPIVGSFNILGQRLVSASFGILVPEQLALL
jgi:hypothetical protein